MGQATKLTKITRYIRLETKQLAEIIPEKFDRSKQRKLNELNSKRSNQLNSKMFPSEKWFLKLLKKNKITGFKRNYCLCNKFFGDFVFKREKIVVEIDGKSHDGKEEYDSWRDEKIKKLGYQVIRIKFRDTEKALKIINHLKFIQTSNSQKQKLIHKKNPKTKSEQRAEINSALVEFLKTKQIKKI